ncbi:uncharacterized protein GLRG_11015 [Colletotrichum graminicola M1.001]|uniref:Secreted protein n=1 Tax=Colletotrichum graminicola (strain M1.001 / M2 / FGSC 10212) TaxID=645133 RepID=E3QYG9_COLGM|nr:uncharacterized protein GLRG_11015 [Colletotrichum graminicola M1.001]EFQ35907.1 hypothetical protein GLRG_11015 [Colletotrichum graminicola M1.001]
MWVCLFCLSVYLIRGTWYPGVVCLSGTAHPVKGMRPQGEGPPVTVQVVSLESWQGRYTS